MGKFYDSLPAWTSLACLLAILALMVGLYLQPDLQSGLRYERDSFSGEYWRLLSHAFVHLNLRHLMLNSIALVLVFYLFNEAFRTLNWLAVLAVSAIVSGIGLYYFSPETDWCVGLSGALHGLMLYAVLRARAHWIWPLLLAVKIFVEQWPSLQDNQLVNATEKFIDANVVVDAHLWGAIGGLMIFALVRTIVWLNLMAELNRTR